jgi:hypothetical protein
MANPIALNSPYLAKKIAPTILKCRILRENQSERRGKVIPGHEDKDKRTMWSSSPICFRAAHPDSPQMPESDCKSLWVAHLDVYGPLVLFEGGPVSRRHRRPSLCA